MMLPSVGQKGYGVRIMEYSFLLDIALILLSTKALGMLTRKIQLPQVVGALLAGLILGPVGFGILQETEMIKNIAEIGVVVLMFSAGLETDIKELTRSGFASFIIALMGIIFPIIGGFGVSMFFIKDGNGSVEVLQCMFIGVILTATSVSITVETLKELGKLSTKTGNAILGAALIDDVLGIIALTIISSFAGGTGSAVELVFVVLKLLGFFVFSGLMALLFYFIINPWINKYKKDLRRFSILSLVFCLLMAFCAEKFFGVSDITGAFVAGLILSNTKKTTYVISKVDTVSYMILSPVFFASVGLKVTLNGMNTMLLWFSLLILVIAVLTKIIGCGLGAKLCRYTNLQTLKIGIGMVSRGEVALIVASKGLALGLMQQLFFGPLIIVVVITTIITPIMLKMVYRYQAAHEHTADVANSNRLVDNYVEKQELEMFTQTTLAMHEEIKSRGEEKQRQEQKEDKTK